MLSEEKVGTSSAQYTEQSFHSEEPKIRADEIQDGDLALQVLHTHFEPYTKDEEKRLLRKIDFRLALLMLFVNGIQFVDKLVSL
jgi:MFS transporter, ACS family, allantoate permease